MKKKVLWLVAVVLIIALFVGAYFLYERLSNDYSTDNMGETENTYKAPDITVYNAKGDEVKLSDYIGKPIILNFWASWCPPCKVEMPHFETAYKQNPDIQFLMINATSGDNMADATALIEKEGYTFPVLFDKTGEASYIYNATSLPITYFIDGNGNLVTHAVGMLSEENLLKGINILKETMK